MTERDAHRLDTALGRLDTYVHGRDNHFTPDQTQDIMTILEYKDEIVDAAKNRRASTIVFNRVKSVILPLGALVGAMLLLREVSGDVLRWLIGEL